MSADVRLRELLDEALQAVQALGQHNSTQRLIDASQAVLALAQYQEQTA